MTEIFLKILNMSLSAGWLILAVLVLRLVLRKAPKWIHVLLWGIVALRLVCPFTLESVLSLIPSKQVVPPSIMLEAAPQIHSGVEFINSTVNPILSQTFGPTPAAPANPMQIWIPVGGIVWLIGFAGMVLYGVISYGLLKRKVKNAVRFRDNIYVSGKVSSPFILGFFRPRIYLPEGMEEVTRDCVTAHELSHIHRKDHLWKPLGFLLLSLHWFNPLMWLAYVLLCRDIEMACDEKAIRPMERAQRANYSQALLQCSVSRRAITVCPLAFGEVSVKQRIKSVLNYRKPGFWIVLVSLILCAVLAVCFLTDPKEEFSAFRDKQLAVWTQEGAVDTEGNSQWNFYEITTFEKEPLPGGSSAVFSVKELTDSGIWIKFEPSLLQDGDMVKEVFLKVSDQITLMSPSSAGMIRYVFSFIDNSAIGEDGVQYLSKYSPLEGMPLDYTPEQAQKDGCVVMVNGDVAYGKDLWWNFYMATQAGTPSGIRVLEYYDDPKLGISAPVSYLRDLAFDGTDYHIRWFEDVTEYSREYTYLRRFTANAESPNAAYTSYDRYVLTNDRDITWKDIWKNLTSSMMPSVPQEHLTVYTNLTYPDDPGYGTLSAVQAVLQPQMVPLRIASIEVNSVLTTLDIEVFELLEELEETVYSLLDPEFVRITVLEGDYKNTDYHDYSLEEIIAFSKGENPKLLEYLWLDTHNQINRNDPNDYFNPDRGVFHLWPENYVLTAVLDMETQEIKDIYLSNPTWRCDVVNEDVEAFLAGWEKEEPDSRLEEGDAERMGALVDEICASSPEASDPNACIEAHRGEYDKLLRYGKKALRWAFTELKDSKIQELRGCILAQACRDIMASWGEVYEMEQWFYMTGRLWLGQFQMEADNLRLNKTVQYIRENHPGAWILLNMTY